MKNYIQRPIFLSTIFQLFISIIVISISSIVLAILSPSKFETSQILLYSSIGCLAASIIGFYLIKGIGKYPGVEQFFYTIPAFSASYGSLLAILILSRIPYSRPLLIISFIASISIFIAGYAILRRKMKLRIGVIPVGEYARLLETPGVDWQLLTSPDTPIDDLDAVSVDLWCAPSDEWERELASFALRGIPVYHSKHLRESLTGQVEIERLSENNFGTLSPLYAYMAVKHAVDWIVAVITLIALLPMLIALGVLIRLDSPGPVIFRQVRIGYQGKPFRVFKFRTMTIGRTDDDDNAARDAAMTKDNDQRVTRIGKFLRHSRIDELPQLLNVLKGEMSWIGPRPEAEVLSRWYESEIPFYRYRHIVRPGITGWAQVHQGHVADVDQVREKLNFDFYYIKNFSLWIDVIVVARTIRTMATGFGSR